MAFSLFRAEHCGALALGKSGPGAAGTQSKYVPRGMQSDVEPAHCKMEKAARKKRTIVDGERLRGFRNGRCGVMPGWGVCQGGLVHEHCKLLAGHTLRRNGLCAWIVHVGIWVHERGFGGFSEKKSRVVGNAER
jgi:hypothetical protein